MEERLEGLRRFYTSPVWQETGAEAVSMLSGRARHVHFLEPVAGDDGFPSNAARPLLLSEVPEDASAAVLVVEVFEVVSDLASTALAVREEVIPALEEAGGTLLGVFRSSEEENNFPILPYIEDETVVVVFASFETRAHYQQARVPEEVPRLESFVLAPGARSRLASSVR